MFQAVFLMVCALMAAITHATSRSVSPDQHLTTPSVVYKDANDLVVTPAASSTTATQTWYTYHEPWCIYQENGLSYSWSVVIPHDGSSTEDGVDPKCECGGYLLQKLRKKGIAITKWNCHYGPENASCATFDTPFLLAAANKFIEPVYKDVTGLALDCNMVSKNVVCPIRFGKGANLGC